MILIDEAVRPSVVVSPCLPRDVGRRLSATSPFDWKHTPSPCQRDSHFDHHIQVPIRGFKDRDVGTNDITGDLIEEMLAIPGSKAAKRQRDSLVAWLAVVFREGSLEISPEHVHQSWAFERGRIELESDHNLESIRSRALGLDVLPILLLEAIWGPDRRRGVRRRRRARSRPARPRRWRRLRDPRRRPREGLRDPVARRRRRSSTTGSCTGPPATRGTAS
jgi:hypothetical protein